MGRLKKLSPLFVTVIGLLTFILGALAAIAITVFLLWKAADDAYVADFIPPAFGQPSLKSRSSFVAGFGPGGYDAVLAFFSMPADVATEIIENGVDWLANAENSVELRRSRQSGPWLPTPIDENVFAWAGSQRCTAEHGSWRSAYREGHACPGVASYLGGYGFLDELDPDETDAANAIIFSEGAYISKRRLGYLVVAPNLKTIIFIHAG